MKTLIIAMLATLGLALSSPTANAGAFQPPGYVDTAYQGADYADGYHHKIYVKDEECDGRPVRVEYFTSTNGTHRFKDADGCHGDGTWVRFADDVWVCKIQVAEQRDDGLWVGGTWKNIDVARC